MLLFSKLFRYGTHMHDVFSSKVCYCLVQVKFVFVLYCIVLLATTDVVSSYKYFFRIYELHLLDSANMRMFIGDHLFDGSLPHGKRFE